MIYPKLKLSCNWGVFDPVDLLSMIIGEILKKNYQIFDYLVPASISHAFAGLFGFDIVCEMVLCLITVRALICFERCHAQMPVPRHTRNVRSAIKTLRIYAYRWGWVKAANRQRSCFCNGVDEFLEQAVCQMALSVGQSSTLDDELPCGSYNFFKWNYSDSSPKAIYHSGRQTA